MSLRRESDIYVLYCDGQDCVRSFAGSEDFKETLAVAKDEGWKITKGEFDWLHHCSECC